MKIPWLIGDDSLQLVFLELNLQGFRKRAVVLVVLVEELFILLLSSEIFLLNCLDCMSRLPIETTRCTWKRIELTILRVVL